MGRLMRRTGRSRSAVRRAASVAPRERRTLADDMESQLRAVPRTYRVRTYGCQMNVHDSERLAGLLEQAGYAAAI